MMQIAYTVCRTTVHTVTITMQHHDGHFPTSNKIEIVANKL